MDKEQLELIVRAREVLNKQKAEIEDWLSETDEIWTSQEAKDRAVSHLRQVDCHLAEMDDLEKEGKIALAERRTFAYYDLADKLLTKSKRLLGVE